MVGATHEIAVYIHRFHNLDLFQQGWYQIRIKMRWQGGDYDSWGTPARVAQYEAPDLGSDNIYGVWKIDDTDHSFSTAPFRIRYARQDILLSMMVSFNFPLGKFERGLPTSAVFLKFELLHTPVLGNRSAVMESLVNAAAVHEFRLPSKALLGLHAYCPVHFDTFHSVLVDVTVHVCLLKAAERTKKVPRCPTPSNEDSVVEGHDKSKQDILMQALTSSRDILIEELTILSQAINQPIDIKDVNAHKLLGFVPGSSLEIASPQTKSQADDEADFHRDVPESQPEDKQHDSIELIANQVTYLWGIFLNFHRDNAKKILKFLYHRWSVERKVEWSIWMVYTKVEMLMPHRYISSSVYASYQELHGKLPISQKIAGDPAQVAVMRAERHRQSIAQMMINSRSIQDMLIFGNPSRIPIVIVEQVYGAPLHSLADYTYFSQINQKGTNNSIFEFGSKLTNALSGTNTHSNGQFLKIVVFVHGFQGHHLDLRLVRNQWLLIDPKVEFLMSEINEEKTSGDFREMGQRLAEEVVSFVKKKMDKVSSSGVLRTIKLSFVGHSIGNIILRTALTDSIMTPYLQYLHTYVSLSGPHLGYLYSSNSLFNGGMWLLKRLKGTQCIHQLTFTDDPDLRNTFLYKLSMHKTLEHFKNVILLSSPQDGYVPYHSARIEMCPASSGDHTKRGQVFVEMLNQCLVQLRPSEDCVFMRCDVNFDGTLQGKNLDNIIGRAAHIEFLESDIYIKFIMWSFPELFR